MEKAVLDLDHVRVLIANENRERVVVLAGVVAGLGHDVILEESDAAATMMRSAPDVALVGLGTSPQQALALIGEIVHEDACPVIALMPAHNSTFVRDAAKRGVFGSVFSEDPSEIQDAIEVAIRRFADYHNLQRAFTRRAKIEQAKGILIARNQMSADEAFTTLRRYSRQTGTKLIDVADAVVKCHGLIGSVGPHNDVVNGRHAAV